MEELEGSGEEDGVCLNLAPDVVITEDDPVVNVEITPDIKFSATDDCDAGQVKHDVYYSLGEVSVPEGLEIIPIYKHKVKTHDQNLVQEHLNSLSQNATNNSNNQKKSVSSLNLKMRSNINKERCSGIEDIPKKKLKSELENHVKNSEDIMISCSGLPSEKGNIVESELNSSMDVTSILSQHFLVTSKGEETAQEDKDIAQTNLEMLIGLKSDYVHFCKMCGVESESKTCITEHINSIHSSREGYEMSIKCPHCPYKNINKRKLENHVASHTAKKRFQCVECGFSSAAKALLMKHVTIHLEKDPFQCDQCGYTSHERHRVRIHKESKHGVPKKT